METHERCLMKCDSKQCILDKGHSECHKVYVKGCVITFSRCDEMPLDVEDLPDDVRVRRDCAALSNFKAR